MDNLAELSTLPTTVLGKTDVPFYANTQMIIQKMKKKNGLIIASHGYFANEALNSVKMISGDIDEEIIRTYSMTLGKDLDTVVEEINDEILNLSRSVENVYLFTDLMGGTPSNASITS